MNTKDACLISVIVPAYNVESYIEECIISILNQSYENIEVIIVNDGSTDKTGIICESLSNIDERICYYSQNNKGVSEARNKGLEAASGEYVMFVDGDDYISTDMITSLLGAFNDSVDIVSCCCMAVSYNESRFEDHFFDMDRLFLSPEEKNDLFCQLIDPIYGQRKSECVTAIGVPWGKLYRKRFLEDNELKFEIRLRRLQDNVFNMYAFGMAKAICYIDSPLYYYRVDHISSMRNNHDIRRLEFWMDINERVLVSRQKFFFDNPKYETEKIRSLMLISTIHTLSDRLMWIVSSNIKYNKSVKREYDKIKSMKHYEELFSNYYLCIKLCPNIRDRIKLQMLIKHQYCLLFNLMKIWSFLKTKSR